jgi:hypothetical protein
MAEKDFIRYKEDRQLGAPYLAEMKYLEEYVDFTVAGNQTAGASDSLNIWELPKGTVVVAAGIEQIVAGSAGNTYKARVGTVDYSGTLASDAAVGTQTASATIAASGDVQALVLTAGAVLTADTDFNILSASGVRATGVARVWVVVIETKKPTGRPILAIRDTSTGTA